MKSGVVTPRIIQGRRIDAEELAFIRGLIAGHPQWSRRQLSIGFCERVQWRSPAGQLKPIFDSLKAAFCGESWIYKGLRAIWELFGRRCSATNAPEIAFGIA